MEEVRIPFGVQGERIRSCPRLQVLRIRLTPSVQGGLKANPPEAACIDRGRQIGASAFPRRKRPGLSFWDRSNRVSSVPAILNAGSAGWLEVV